MVTEPLSEEWVGKTIFEILNFPPKKNHYWVSGRETKIQQTSRPGNVWPEVWDSLSDKKKEKAIAEKKAKEAAKKAKEAAEKKAKEVAEKEKLLKATEKEEKDSVTKAKTLDAEIARQKKELEQLKKK